MKYQQTLSLFSLGAAWVTGLPVIEEHGGTSKSLSPRENPVQVPRFCPYTKAKELGKSVHHMQVSDTLACSDGECEVSQTTEHSFGIETSVELGADAAKLVGTISASVGVTVTESWTNGKTKTCAGGENESVCIWVAVPYHKVEMSDRDAGITTCNNPKTAEGNFPEDKGPSENYYCVRGKDNCRADGDGYWVEK